jgi:hypothetical protein
MLSEMKKWGGGDVLAVEIPQVPSQAISLNLSLIEGPSKRLNRSSWNFLIQRREHWGMNVNMRKLKVATRKLTGRCRD